MRAEEVSNPYIYFEAIESCPKFGKAFLGMGEMEMAEPPKSIEEILGGLSDGIGQILNEQKALGSRLEALEDRIHQIEGEEEAPAPVHSERSVMFDYRVLEHVRRYTILDVKGHKAEMVSTRRCLALRDLPELRTRYHTGSGSREIQYAYRIIEDEQEFEPEWIPVEFKTASGAGADYSAELELPAPIRSSQLFELRNVNKLVDTFVSHNEWVTLVVEYPTEKFILEVLLPSERMVTGARRETSEGASQTFNKRRVIPRTVADTGQISLLWTEDKPLTGRTYTMFWDW